MPRQAGAADRFQTSVPSRIDSGGLVSESAGTLGRRPENLDRRDAGSFPSSVSRSAAGPVGPRASDRRREGALCRSRGNGRRHPQGRASRHRDGPPRGGPAGRDYGRDLSDSGRRSDRDAPHRRGRPPPAPGAFPPNPFFPPPPRKKGGPRTSPPPPPPFPARTRREYPPSG